MGEFLVGCPEAEAYPSGLRDTRPDYTLQLSIQLIRDMNYHEYATSNIMAQNAPVITSQLK